MTATRRDWFVVAAIAISFIVIPVAIVLNPPPLPFRFTFLILPLIPAIVLAAVGVWYALTRRE